MNEFLGKKVEFFSFPETEQDWTLQEIESKPKESRVKTYTIKPLEWEKSDIHNPEYSDFYTARPANGSWLYVIVVHRSNGDVFLKGKLLLDDSNYKGEFPELDVHCNSIEDAKSKAQQHWESDEGIGSFLQETEAAE